MYKEENDKLVEIEQENITVVKGGSTDYKELENKPSINNVTLVDNLNLEDLGINNFSGDYTELKNKPTIPAKLSDLENDGDFISDETDPTVPEHVKNITEENIKKWNEEYELPVATEEILGGVKIGANLSIDESGNLSAEKVIKSYTELSDKPKINNIELDSTKSLEELGIQPKGDYALKSEIPTNISDLNNDSEFLTSIPDSYKTKEENDELYQAKGDYATKDELPTKISQLENDSNFISEIPVASTSTLGGIKVGDNLEITADGILSASGGGSAGITILEGTEEAPVNLQNLTEAGLYFVKNYYIPSALYAKIPADRLIINYSVSPTRLIQMSISSESAGRFYWYARMYDKTTKKWDKDDFPARYNEVTNLNDDSNYYNGSAILNYYGKKTKLETTNKNNLVNAINELVARVTALEEKAGE